MKELIDKAALVAEIKKIEHETNYEPFTDEVLGKRCVCRSLLSFLNTLEVKEVDLDYIKKELDKLIRIYKPIGDFGWGTLYNVATHFFELGLKMKGE